MKNIKIYHEKRFENRSACFYISCMKPKMNKFKSKRFIPSELPFSILLVWNTPDGYPCRNPQLNQREFWKITYVTQGTGIMQINGKRYPVSKGSICLSHPDDQTTWELQEPIQVYNILFMLRFIESELKHLHDPGNFLSVFDQSFQPENSWNHNFLHLLDSNRKILSIIKKMYGEYEHKGILSDELLRCYLLELLIELARHSDRTYRRKRRKEIIGYIHDCLQKTFASGLDLRHIADKTGFSVSYLQAFYKDKTGESIGKTLLRIRLLKAQELLRGTDLPIEQLCRNCGFPDPADFYHVFKRETGETPGTWRKKSREVQDK